MIIKHCEICGKEIYASPSNEKSKRFCSKQHFRQWQSIKFSGEGNPAYKGGTSIYTNGKKRIKPGVFEYKLGTSFKVAVHRLNAEAALGRKLHKGEQVHHINGNSLDNRNQNLLICTIGYHRFLHENMSRLYMKEHF